MSKENTHALVVLSGGQDSATCLAEAVERHTHVSAITFAYNQRHAIEVNCARMVCRALHINPPHVVHLGPLFSFVTESALINGDMNINATHKLKPNLPASFVPNRNALFLTLAHAHAQTIGAQYLYTGVCQTDYSGYPDCREDFIKKLEAALNSGSEKAIEIVTPLMYLTKAETFEMAYKLGVIDTIINFTNTCYEGGTAFHEWGYGCGECPACNLRLKGYQEFVKMHENDPEE